MFTKNTVLVLGAGASCHYGYPTGEELIDRILRTLENKTFKYQRKEDDFYADLSLLEDKRYKALFDHLKFYDPLSIDFFLSQYTHSDMKEMIDAGKTMIAYEILQAEDRKLLERTYANLESGKEKDQKNNENWYRFLHHAITTNATPQQLIKDELKLHIVTFNYDNSLEYALYSRFHNSPILLSNAEKFLKKVSDNIVHIYGQVGKFKWKGGTDRADDDYGKFKDNAALKKAEESWKDTIYVIGEDRDDRVKQNAGIAIKWLDKAEVIYFLGFGFNNDNIDLLKLRESAVRAKNIFATNYGDSSIIRERIENLFNREWGSTRRMTIQGQEDYFPNRWAKISAKTVYEALAKDFTLID